MIEWGILKKPKKVLNSTEQKKKNRYRYIQKLQDRQINPKIKNWNR